MLTPDEQRTCMDWLGVGILAVLLGTDQWFRQWTYGQLGQTGPEPGTWLQCDSTTNGKVTATRGVRGPVIWQMPYAAFRQHRRESPKGLVAALDQITDELAACNGQHPGRYWVGMPDDQRAALDAAWRRVWAEAGAIRERRDDAVRALLPYADQMDLLQYAEATA